MTFQSDIQGVLRDAQALFGASWQYETLTSAPDATKAYAAGVTFTAQLVGSAQTQAYSDDRRAYRKAQRATLKCSDAIALQIGDRLIEPVTTDHWHVMEVMDAIGMDGIKRYVIERAIDTKGGDKARSGV